MEQPITLRPETPEDDSFLLRLYASTRARELSVVPWTYIQKAAFAQSQFALQRHHYRKYHPDADFLIILRDGAPIGRFYVDRTGEQISLIDISLLPEFCGAGIGGGLLATLLDEGAAAQKPVEIHVEVNNPAKHLYDRLGFLLVEEQGMYLRMRWNPGAV